MAQRTFRFFRTREAGRLRSRWSLWRWWVHSITSITLSAWWRHQMETFSALLALYAGNSPVTGEFPSQRPAPRKLGVFFDLRLNKRLNKRPRRRWFETPSRSSWHRCNGKLELSGLLISQSISIRYCTVHGNCKIKRIIIKSENTSHISSSWVRYGVYSSNILVKSTELQRDHSVILCPKHACCPIPLRRSRVVRSTALVISLQWRHNGRDGLGAWYCVNVLLGCRRFKQLYHNFWRQLSAMSNQTPITSRLLTIISNYIYVASPFPNYMYIHCDLFQHSLTWWHHRLVSCSIQISSLNENRILYLNRTQIWHSLILVFLCMAVSYFQTKS